MALTYFGACDSSGVASGASSNSDSGGIVFWRAYTCPGSGQQTVSEIASFVHNVSSTSHVRLAIYDSTFATLLAESDSIVPSSASTDTWDNAAIAAIALTGGADYGLAITFGADGAGSATTHGDETRSNGSFKVADYTAGFPSPLDTPVSASFMYPIRVGVEPALIVNVQQPIASLWPMLVAG